MENKTIKIILSIVVVIIAIYFGLPLLGKGVSLIFSLVGNILGLFFVLIPLALIIFLIYWVFFKNKNQQ
ncbi:MAG: hypothetical protein GX238_09290 [Epulopiscium sp.]|mgnify:CR=1 FL=1|nr:hypothetical protein [Candidatus Epulonipiscium sp.]